MAPDPAAEPDAGWEQAPSAAGDRPASARGTGDNVRRPSALPGNDPTEPGTGPESLPAHGP
eukprot:11159600-Lingulodinium_polyedra.AAC.1